MSVSPAAARKMQIIGAIMIPIGAVLLVIGAIKFSELIFGGMDLGSLDFGAIIATQMAAMGFLFGGIAIAFVGLILLIIGKTRKSMSAGAATAVPSTISSPVSTIGNQANMIGTAMGQEVQQGQPAVTQGSATKFCPYCGAMNSKDAPRCIKCTGQL